MTNKVHLIADGNVGPTYVTTRCGMEGWRDGMAMALSEHGRDGLTPSDRERIDRLIEAYRD